MRTTQTSQTVAYWLTFCFVFVSEESFTKLGKIKCDVNTKNIPKELKSVKKTAHWGAGMKELRSLPLCRWTVHTGDSYKTASANTSAHIGSLRFPTSYISECLLDSIYWAAYITVHLTSTYLSLTECLNCISSKSSNKLPQVSQLIGMGTGLWSGWWGSLEKNGISRVYVPERT